ncbi:MAG: HDOD domain-containing protein [Deltaproteobacteria bacterium]|nr:HDOD domain-containing protein [Deltaproteobacteria bacterium]
MEQQVAEQIMKGMESPSFQPPIFPAVAQEALQISKDPDLDLQTVATIIEKDSALAARFLSVGNSSLYRRGAPATSVKASLARMGLIAARDLLVFAAVEKSFFTSKQLGPAMKKLRNHTLAVSAGCAYLAQYKRINADDASLAGLVHDLGASAVFKFVTDKATQFKDLLANETSLNNVVAHLHCKAGAKIAARWELPEPVLKVIADHHAGGNDPLLVLVAAADELSAMCQMGASFDKVQKGALADFLGGADPEIVTDAFMMRLADIDAM